MNDSHGPDQRVIENHQQFLSTAGGQAEEGPGGDRRWPVLASIAGWVTVNGIYAVLSEIWK